MAVDECCGSVVFAEQAAVDVVKPIPGDESVPAGGTCETLRGGGGDREGTDHNQARGARSSAQSYYVIRPWSQHMLVNARHKHTSVCAGVSGS